MSTDNKESASSSGTNTIFDKLSARRETASQRVEMVRKEQQLYYGKVNSTQQEYIDFILKKVDETIALVEGNEKFFSFKVILDFDLSKMTFGTAGKNETKGTVLHYGIRTGKFTERATFAKDSAPGNFVLVNRKFDRSEDMPFRRIQKIVAEKYKDPKNGDFFVLLEEPRKDEICLVLFFGIPPWYGSNTHYQLWHHYNELPQGLHEEALKIAEMKRKEKTK